MTLFSFNPKTVLFDLKVTEICRNCQRFGKCGTCPPNIPSMDYYQKLLPTYKNGILFVQMFCVEGTIWESSKDSSLAIFNAVNKERETLRKEGHYFISAFGAGSCKACDTCSVPCSAPENSIVPLEATGINVVLLAEKFGIKIVFPVGRDFYRLGALFYD